jgi:threonine dehydratase
VTTPVEWYPDHGGVYLKRDDLFVAPGGAPGGKARTCYSLIADGLGTPPAAGRGVVTAGSRSSPQVNIVAQICRALGVPCRVHTPTGKPGPEVEAAVAAGAERVEHFPGYNTVLVKRAEDDARARGWVLVPFGMDHPEAVRQTAKETTEESIAGAARIVVPVGSGMSLCGIIAGMESWSEPLPVLGVIVGVHR